MRRNLSVLSNQRIILIICQGRHHGSVFGTTSSEQCLSQRAQRFTEALARAGVKGSSKAFNPKGRAIRFGSPVKGISQPDPYQGLGRGFPPGMWLRDRQRRGASRIGGPDHGDNNRARRKERKALRRWLY